MTEISNTAGSALAAQVADLRAEARDLDTLLGTLRRNDWPRVTAFKRWTVWDVVAHLHLSDEMALRSVDGEEPFRVLMDDMRAHGGSMAAYARDRFSGIDGPALHRRWREQLDHLCDRLAGLDPEARLPWVGPPMKPRMFATARQMETWAHGWEIFDLLGVARTHTDRLFNVATIGVRTFGWTFRNRGEPLPGEPPQVRLVAPSGASWVWNDDNAENLVAGNAVEFCQVVTQVRNVADTALDVRGDAAVRWMAVAQCFAGPPADPPAPGSRPG